MFKYLSSPIRHLRQRYKLFTTHPLTKNRPFEAAKRYAQFHLGHKLLPQPALYPFVNDLHFLAQPGVGYIGHNIYVGLHDFDEMGFLMHFLRKGDLFVDVGANVGAYSLLAAGVCEADVISAEPVPITYQHLCRNVSLNALEHRITTCQIGIGASEATLQFSIDKNDALNRVIANAASHAETLAVPTLPLDTVCEAKPPSMLKIDVEGFEKHVLQGASETLRQATLKAVLIELNGSGKRYATSDVEVANILEEQGFSSYTYSPMQRRLAKANLDQLPAGDVLFLRNPDQVQERLASASAFYVLDQVI